MGASYIGASLTTAGFYVTGAASPVSQIALLVGQDGQISRMMMGDGTLTSANLPSGTVTTKIRFSPSGTAAVIFVPGGTTATMVTGLASTMQVQNFTLPTALTEAVVSDAGSIVALSKSQGGETISVLRGDGTASLLATLSGSGAVTFVGTGDDLLTVDSGTGTLRLTHSVSTSPNPVTVSTSNLLKTPIALGAAVSGRWVVAVNSGESSVVRIDLTGQTAPQRIWCPVQPLFAEPLAYGAFRFSDAGASPAWVTDITASNPAMFFVPAIPSTPASGI